MVRIFHKYELWEDWKNGLYKTINIKENEALVKQSMALLSNPEKFYSVMQRMIKEWKHSTDIHLSDNGINRRSWLGRASCCFNHGASENIVRVAWVNLTDEQRSKANFEAEKIIQKYENKGAFFICVGGIWLKNK